MKYPLTAKLAALFVTLAATFAPGLASAQMIPIEDIRTIAVDATHLGVTDAEFLDPPGPFAIFNGFVDALVEDDDGHCTATAFQISEFFPGGIHFSGGTSGNWGNTPGNYSALSTVAFRFRIDRCHQYQMDSFYTPGDFGEGRIDVKVPGTDLAYLSGAVHLTGRLPAGEYEVRGDSYIISTRESVEGPTYAVQWVCTPCITTLVASHPRDVTIACGGTAVFSVAPTGPLAGLTFQWRRDLVPLTNSGHVSGATTQTLTINNACDADAGYYDVVLSDGTIIEPSQLARLSVTTISGVDPVAESPQPAFSIQAAGPNPFSGTASFRYAAAAPQHATIAIYNASGARIRTLVAGPLSGSGTIRWDGNTETGARAPAGIYFLRVEAGSIKENRKIVLVR